MPATMHKTPSEEEIAETLNHLALSTTVPQKPAHKPKSKPVADSWEDEEEEEEEEEESISSHGSDTETETGASPRSVKPAATNGKEATSPADSLQPLSTTTSRDTPPNPPPPTPASPTGFDYPDHVAPYNPGMSRSGSASASGNRSGLDKRPEKTTAVAGRLIAGALGVRAPKRTDEEREYDRVMREKERRRRTEEKEREKKEAEERERRKKAVWDD